MPNTYFDLLAFSFVFCLTVLLYRWRTKTVYPLPPGPKRLPIIGNFLDMPKSGEWVTYRKWGKDCGSDIIHVDTLGTPFIILNSAKAANDLLEKRSSLYSDRPALVAITKILLLDWGMPVLPYGQTWRKQRKAFEHYSNSSASLNYRDIQEKGVQDLLRRLSETPQDFMEHIRHMSGQTILEMAYGIEVQSYNDPYIDAAEKVLQAIAFASTAKASIFDALPFLVHVPTWFPGFSFQKEARKWVPYCTELIETPYRAAKEAVVRAHPIVKENGTARPSVVSSMLAQLENDRNSLDEDLVKHVPGTMYIAGVDTTVSAIFTFFLAMVLYPEVQKKAQAEIDAIIGHDRLPEFADEDSLPYTTALMKEVLRWHPVAPLGVPHRVVSDDIYEGYHIPAGSLIIGNSWAMLHDESIFPDAASFKPERFLGPSANKFPDAAFGFGRRVCPGRFIARASIWITIASVLATFDISKAVDDDGKLIEPAEEYSSGLVSYPAPFRCQIRSRSLTVETLIRSVVD
ncbi:hypothetical protein EW146_g6885 [Bondarzewia mesenterica]|uniref:Cytochrome P450 n=1 Tax=Bondarzewia mesenterica TaxID=1095465 RepID=A0A4S4LMF4_9AGAM|nr:hypothetical protein EW146_g6885 [Bondarzewia mesenterica]